MGTTDFPKCVVGVGCRVRRTISGFSLVLRRLVVKLTNVKMLSGACVWLWDALPGVGVR
jgi:hypothetical protein